MGIGPLDQGGATREPSSSKGASHSRIHRWRKRSGCAFGTCSLTTALTPAAGGRLHALGGIIAR